MVLVKKNDREFYLILDQLSNILIGLKGIIVCLLIFVHFNCFYHALLICYFLVFYLYVSWSDEQYKKSRATWDIEGSV